MIQIKCATLLIVCALLCGFTGSASAASVWETFRAGQAVALMRHALAPGGGDPTQFLLGDCSTQRNLSEEGRAQSKRIAALMKEQGIDAAQVLTSQWCRCMDTATGLGFSAPQELPMLNSFFQDRSTALAQTTQLSNWIKNRLENITSDPILPAVLVTHQVNITGLTNVFPQSGEIVFVGLKDGKPVVLEAHLTQ